MFIVCYFVCFFAGYIRLALIIAAWINIENPKLFIIFYSTNCILDSKLLFVYCLKTQCIANVTKLCYVSVVDGIAARCLHQVSDFGAVLDVLVDIFGRGIVWCYLGKVLMLGVI